LWKYRSGRVGHGQLWPSERCKGDETFNQISNMPGNFSDVVTCAFMNNFVVYRSDDIGRIVQGSSRISEDFLSLGLQHYCCKIVRIYAASSQKYQFSVKIKEKGQRSLSKFSYVKATKERRGGSYLKGCRSQSLRKIIGFSPGKFDR
jgi:hypothetical protein